MEKESPLGATPPGPDHFCYVFVSYSEATVFFITILTIHPAVDLFTGELLISSEIALNETLSNAPSMSRKISKTYPFLTILRSIVCAVCYLM